MARAAPPRVHDLEVVIDLLLCFPNGLQVVQIRQRLGLPGIRTEGALRELRKAKRAAFFSPVERLWVAAVHAPALAEARRQQSKLATAARLRQQRAEGKFAFDPDRVPDMPIKQPRLAAWEPVRSAPGPTSVFDLGERHA